MCACVCAVAANWSCYLPPNLLPSHFPLRCLSPLSPHYKNYLTFTFPSLSRFFFPLSAVKLSSSLSLLLLSVLPSLFSFLLIIQQLEATTQPYVSENCHLTLLASTISSLGLVFKVCPKPSTVPFLLNSQTN